MKILRVLLFYVALVFAPFVIFTNAYGANINFTGNVGLVEVRAPVFGNVLIMTILNSSGARIRLCDAAQDPTALAIPMTDPLAKNFQAIALSAKLAGKQVTGWGVDQTVSSWCGIGNFVIP